MNNLNSEKFNQLLDEINKQLKKNIEENKAMSQSQQKLQSNSDIKCSKCHHFVYQTYVQTRSSDEDATLFYWCINPDCPLFEIKKKGKD